MCVDDNHNYPTLSNYDTRCSWEWLYYNDIRFSWEQLRCFDFKFFGSILFVVILASGENSKATSMGGELQEPVALRQTFHQNS